MKGYHREFSYYEGSNNFSIHTISTSTGFIHGMTQDNSEHISWLTTFIYGYPQQHILKTNL